MKNEKFCILPNKYNFISFGKLDTDGNNSKFISAKKIRSQHRFPPQY